MDKVSLFKEFVKKNPGLLKFVKNNEMTWQKFYEIYDLYGEEETAWKDYLNNDRDGNTAKATAAAASAVGIGEIFNWLKNVNLDTVKEGVGNLQKVIGVVQDISKKDTPSKPKEEYRPRPIYKHFED